MRYQSYFNTAIGLLTQYKGAQPLVHYLKAYFAMHKKHGSRDRKIIAHLCYTYYRLGHAVKDLPVEERMRIALFLCNGKAGEWHILYDAEWLAGWDEVLENRLAYLQKRFQTFSTLSIFPWHTALSEGIDAEAFAVSHLLQPDLFLRIRPGKEKTVLRKLTEASIPFRSISDTCLSLANGTKLEDVLAIDAEAVVQDYSSQQIESLLKQINLNPETEYHLWDCCAASGGKSLLAMDCFWHWVLTVSDIRPAILRNLKERFDKAGIRNYQSFVADLTSPAFQWPQQTGIKNFDTILCDAPCSGSGTWGRTPEQLYFFSEEQISIFARRQKQILQQVLPHLKPGGYLLYITCSVFKQENEDRVQELCDTNPLTLVDQQLFKGYSQHADTMFAALLRKT
ncbi:MAG: methyltransferase domain-containing protein [Bacteroidota bacterium]|nr:methyltransferase domain-containing protein [Bacteroidota bacterium]